MKSALPRPCTTTSRSVTFAENGCRDKALCRLPPDVRGDIWAVVLLEVHGSMIKNQIEWICDKCRGKDVLDVGCCGLTINKNKPVLLHGELKKVTKELVGIDIDGGGVARMVGDGFNVLRMDAESFKLYYSFDVVFAGRMFEHLSNPGLFLDGARRHLTARGALVLTFPRPVLLTNRGGWHTRTYDFYTLRNLLKRHGFVDVKEHYLTPGSRTLKGRLFNLVLRIVPALSNTVGVTCRRG